ncbi:hypothetical protein C8Q79DRAFT_1004493 [Trametes meyenii]|nr:hypothetical protein C8Q79DRAFT_1004493 [Trametes meyenii]
MRLTSLCAVFPIILVQAVLAKPNNIDKEPIAYYSVNDDGTGRVSLGDMSPNGLYAFHNETHFAYHGEADAQSVLKYGRSPMAPRATDEFTCVPSCNGEQNSNTNDIQNAENGLAAMLGGGTTWSHSLVYVYGTTYAFACDYKGSQTNKASDYWASISCVNSNCGTTQGGWDSIHDWKATFGRQFHDIPC